MDNVGRTPFYIEYRYSMWNNLGECRVWRAAGAERSRIRLLRALVRIGDYKVDKLLRAARVFSDHSSHSMATTGAPANQIWLATDQAYKGGR